MRASASRGATLGHVPGCPNHGTKGGTAMKDSSMNRWLWLIGLVAVVRCSSSRSDRSRAVRPARAPSGRLRGALVQHPREPAVGLDLARRPGPVPPPGVRDPAAPRPRPDRRSAAVAQHASSRRASCSSTGIVVAGSFEMTLILACAQPRVRRGALRQLLQRQQRSADPRRHGFPDPLRRSGHPAQPAARRRCPSCSGGTPSWWRWCGAAGPLSFFALLFGFPIWLIATGIVIAVKQSRGTLGGDPATRAAQRR